MVTRRQSLSVIGAALLYDPLHRFAIASGFGAAKCSSCSAAAYVESITNPISSAARLKQLSPPSLLLPARGLGRDGMVINHVRTRSGTLAFRMQDIKVNCTPALAMDRFYDGNDRTDTGLGMGWRLGMDDRIEIIGAQAHFNCANGDSPIMDFDRSSGMYVPSGLLSTQHQALAMNTDGNLTESFGNLLSRVYRRHGSSYMLDEIDARFLGKIQIARRSDGRIERMTHLRSGAYIQLLWADTKGGQLEAVCDHTGRTVQYAYHAGKLASLSNLLGGSVNVVSGEDGLSDIFDAEGRRILEAKYEGGRVARVFSAEGVCGFSYAFEEGSIATTVIPGGEPASRIIHQADGSINEIQTSAGNFQIAIERQAARMFRPDGRTSEIRAPKNAVRPKTPFDVRRNSVSGDTVLNVGSGGDVISIRLSSLGRAKSLRYGKIHRTYSINENGWLMGTQLGKYQATCKRNPEGQLIYFSDYAELTFEMVRDRSGAIDTVRAGQAWVKAYRDRFGRVTRMRNHLGQERHFSFNALGRLELFRDAAGRSFQFSYRPTSGHAYAMVELGGTLAFVRGSNASDSDAVIGAQQLSIGAFDDGWTDPLGALGLLGSLSGQIVRSGPRQSRGSAAVLAGGMSRRMDESGQAYSSMEDDPFGSTDEGGSGGDFWPEQTPDGGDGSDEPSNDEPDDPTDEPDGDMTPDDTDPTSDDPEPDPDPTQPSTSAACQSCYDDYYQVCENSYTNAIDGLRHAEIGALAVCLPAVAITPVYLGCLLAAAVKFKMDLNTANTNYANCITLVRQSCYSRCN